MAEASVRSVITKHYFYGVSVYQTKTAWGCKKGATKQSRINAITEYDWYEQGLISSCGQVDWHIIIINIKTTGKKKD